LPFLTAHSLNTHDFQAGFDQTNRPHWITMLQAASTGGNEPLFAAVAAREVKNYPSWSSWSGQTLQESEKTHQDMARQGFRPLNMTGYTFGQATLFGSVWVRDGNPDTSEARRELTSAQYEAALTEFRKKGMRPISLSAYPAGAAHHFAVVFGRDAAADWRERHDLTLEEYQRLQEEWAAQGYRPDCLCGYRTGGDTRFAAVFVRHAGPRTWEARVQMTGAEYEREFDRWTARGYAPISLSVYAWGDDLRLAAVWHKP
jgi:hypothetical protein